MYRTKEQQHTHTNTQTNLDWKFPYDFYQSFLRSTKTLSSREREKTTDKFVYLIIRLVLTFIVIFRRCN